MELIVERKVGEVFEYKGFKLITKERPVRCCGGCFFFNNGCLEADTGICYSRYRSDNKNVLFKQLKIMEEKTIKLSLEKAREYYNKGGELRKIALQAYRKDEIFECVMPKTWEEYLDLMYIDDIKKFEEALNVSDTCKAYSKLRYLREYYRQEWEPDWSNEKQTTYCIVENDGLEVEECYQNRQFLAFQTQELAEQFLDNFSDLIIKADIL